MSLGTKSPDNWKWISDTEEFLDTQYETFSRKEKLDVIQILALFSLAFGTSNPSELFLGSAAFIPHYYIGGNGRRNDFGAFWRSNPEEEIRHCGIPYALRVVQGDEGFHIREDSHQTEPIKVCVVCCRVASCAVPICLNRGNQ